MTQQHSEPNLYELSGDTIQITYSTTSLNGQPQCNYTDDQTAITFTSNQIRTQESELGTLVSISLQTTIDTGDTDIILTLFLPPISLAEQAEQDFFTLAILTTRFTIPPHTGAHLTYRPLNLQGIALFMEF